MLRQTAVPVLQDSDRRMNPANRRVAIQVLMSQKFSDICFCVLALAVLLGYHFALALHDLDRLEQAS